MSHARHDMTNDTRRKAHATPTLAHPTQVGCRKLTPRQPHLDRLHRMTWARGGRAWASGRVCGRGLHRPWREWVRKEASNTTTWTHRNPHLAVQPSRAIRRPARTKTLGRDAIKESVPSTHDTHNPVFPRDVRRASTKGFFWSAKCDYTWLGFFLRSQTVFNGAPFLVNTQVPPQVAPTTTPPTASPPTTMHVRRHWPVGRGTRCPVCPRGGVRGLWRRLE
jgi:hypothetical protein